MSERLWPFNQFERFLRYEDPEVRFWAADRLTRYYPEQATSALAPYLFDEHDMTQELVASHLGRRGGSEHLPLLARALRTLRGMPAARSLEALVRLRAPDAIDQVRGAFDRRDFDEQCWSTILEALADRQDVPSRQALAAFLEKRTDWVGSPSILRSALQHAHPGEYRPLLTAWLRSLQWGGAGGSAAGGKGAGEAFRVLMDHLQVDDCGWCFRTTLNGRIDFRKTIKAVESSYDCDLHAALDTAVQARIAAALDNGAYPESVTVLADSVRRSAETLTRAPGDDLADRIVEVTSFWVDPEVVRAVEGLGPHLREWILGFLLSTFLKMCRYRNYQLEVRRATGDVAALLALMELETSALLDDLPMALKRAVDEAGGGDPAARTQARRAVEEHCLSTLAARGPFFPQVMALDTLGETGSAGATTEVMDFLTEENSYLYESAEHALSHFEGAVIEPARARLEAGHMEEEARHSLLVLLCDLGTAGALRVVLDHLDDFVEASGPADASHWMSLFGARELIEPLRGYLRHDLAQVGQALLLLGGIHNVRIPEEGAIRSAIDDYWKQQPETGDESGPEDGSDKYLM